MSDALPVNGRATDSQFSQNPVPLVHAMGVALAKLHAETPAASIEPQTALEVEDALSQIAELEPGQSPPSPFGRVKPESLRTALSNGPTGLESVHTHGAPIVASAVVVDSIVLYESARTEGLDPIERDLAIVFRSIGETFNTEVTSTFLEGYLDGGGRLPNGPALDWYGIIAAFR